MTAIDLMEKEMRFAQPSVSALVFVNVFCMYIPDAYCWVLSFNPEMGINGLVSCLCLSVRSSIYPTFIVGFVFQSLLLSVLQLLVYSCRICRCQGMRSDSAKSEACVH